MHEGEDFINDRISLVFSKDVVDLIVNVFFSMTQGNYL